MEASTGISKSHVINWNPKSHVIYGLLKVDEADTGGTWKRIMIYIYIIIYNIIQLYNDTDDTVIDYTYFFPMAFRWSFFLVGVNLFREIGEIKVETRFWSGGEWSIAPDYRVGVAEAGQLCFAAMEIVTMLEISRWLEMPQFPMKNRWICCFNLLQEIYIILYHQV